MTHFRSIQYLRGLAALLVVFFHTAPPAVGLVGEAGVDIFFVISGFVMWIATAERNVGAAAFLWQRIVRVVPLYWLFTLVLAGAAFALPSAFPRLVLTGDRLIQSLAFIPHIEPGTGKVMPLLVQGWTLNYEMFFYVLMAAALWLPRWWRLAAVCTVLCALGITGALFGRSGALASVYLDPLLMEFAFGLLIGALCTAGLLPSLRGGVVLAAVGVCVLALSALAAETAEHYRVLAWGLSGAALITGLISVERAGGLAEWRLPALIGDASYSLYLTHTFVISIVGKVIEKAFGDPSLKTSFSAGVIVIIASTIVGIIVYRAIEQPLLRALRKPRKTLTLEPQAAR